VIVNEPIVFKMKEDTSKALLLGQNKPSSPSTLPLRCVAAYVPHILSPKKKQRDVITWKE